MAFLFGRSKNKNNIPRNNLPSTQEHLGIAEIRNGMVVLKNGGLRGVLLVSSVNFALKSEDEQKGLIIGFQQVLNSLDFSIQIVVQSRKLDIDQYVLKLKERVNKQKNELLQIQTTEYIDYIQKLIDVANVMTKDFYVVVPFSPIEAKGETPWGKILKALRPSRDVVLRRFQLEKYREQLMVRVSHISRALTSLGLNNVTLNTQELVELYYNTYNISVAEHEDLADIDKLAVEENSYPFPKAKKA